MDRLISEKQVLDAICHDKCGLSPNRCMSGITGECVQIKPIKAIPSAEPKWIPVSERLPQINEWVLCQCRAGYKVLRLTSYRCYRNDTQEYMDSFVIAWMPLPKPYEPQERSE